MLDHDPSADTDQDATAIDDIAAVATVNHRGSGSGSQPPARGGEPSPGERVRHYELIRELGRGGMGRVFLARDTRLGRRVAIKFLMHAAAGVQQRFVVEARATAACQHPHIVVIHEVGVHQGMPFMVLEHLRGKTLADHLRGRVLPPGQAIELAIPIAQAIAFAHDNHIIHRDLKAANVFVTETGVVKVLDFGIAKLAEAAEADPDAPSSVDGLREVSGELTREGQVVGSLSSMPPEQWGADSVDHRSDLFSIGMLMFRMLANRHPLGRPTNEELYRQMTDLATPLPSLGELVPGLPADLIELVDACLAKRKADRPQRAADVVARLEAMLPARRRGGTEDGCPYPGLVAFQETDADRYFGRDAEVRAAAALLGEQAIVAVVGPSGVGKSSFVRAGLGPALKASGEPWELHAMSPGRHPLLALATVIAPLLRVRGQPEVVGEAMALADRLRVEPGLLGEVLRARAARRSTRLLLFVDQLEEAFTLVADPRERLAFLATLASVGDDPASRLRLVMSMRSDLLHRLGEHAWFLDEIGRGLYFLSPPGRDALRDALVTPIERAGLRFESPAIPEQMLDALAGATGALPLLQFAATQLWELRDRGRALITAASYAQLGGIAGTLAVHADRTVAAMPPEAQRLVRVIFLRLVTEDGTRAIVDRSELHGLGEPAAVDAVLDRLVRARLLVIQARGEETDPSIELVHESLISSWPTLRRWIDEGQADAALVARLRAAARPWDAAGRPTGLLWRDDAAQAARGFVTRQAGALSGTERDFLDAVLAFESRQARRRRAIRIGVIAFLLVLVAAAAVALVWINRAEGRARHQAAVAEDEAGRARRAEATTQEQLDLVQRTQQARAASDERAKSAEANAQTSRDEATLSRGELEIAYRRQLELTSDADAARKLAEREAARATAAGEAARTLADKNQELLEQERKRRKELERQLAEIVTELR